MFARKKLQRVALVAGLALGLAGGGIAMAVGAGGHSHGGHPASVAELQLDNGKKWQTDAPLRQGIDTMRGALAAALEPIHQGKYQPADYGALAGKLDAQIGFITANCKLLEAADAQLHLVLAQIIDGIEAMRAGPDREKGAVLAIEALDAYGKHFDHPGWQPLAH